MQPSPKLIQRIDCTQEFPAEEYFSNGDVKVVHSECGTYRECEGIPLSRFGYRFRVENLDKPHMAVIRYPDDKPRFMIIHDSSSYDLSTGIQTGGPWPLSGGMQEIQNVFWARWHDCSIVFMSWGYNQPAAAASIEIYELETLPALEWEGDRPDYKTRTIGVQYEDPCGTQVSEGAVSFGQWLEHITTYMKHSGQKSLCYPICWYHGPFFPSQVQPSDSLGSLIAPDRRQYVLWTTEPADWPAVLLEKFDAEGLEFRGVLTLLRLGKLLENMNIDIEAIKGGAETYNNMRCNDMVQSGTGDWTIFYNARNFEKFLDVQGPVYSADMQYYCDEKPISPNFGPMFNPLHPRVQQTIIEFIREIAQRYSKFKSFKGVNISMWTSTILWFGSLKVGYDDYTTKMFQHETGIEIPAADNAPDRFSKRFEYLISEHQSDWIKWRTKKIHALMQRIRDELVSTRSDLELCLDLWCEMTVPCVYGSGEPEHQIYARGSSLQMFIEAGIDPALYRDEPNIRLKYQIEGGGRDRTMTNLEDCKTENLFMFRDHDYLDSETLKAFDATNNSGALIFNAWHEAWGEHKWLRIEGEDKQAEELGYIYGRKANYCRSNSKYPPDGFWWDSQIRICHSFPTEKHFLEHYAHALAEFDALCITRGGLFLDKAHGRQLQEFARVYNKLPDKKFQTVGVQTDPIAVRKLRMDGKQYIYLINREYYPAEVEIHFETIPDSVIDLGSGDYIKPDSKLVISLAGYELKGLVVPESVKLEGFDTFVADNIINALISQAAQAVEEMKKVQALGKDIPGMEKMINEMKDAAEKRRFAWLRRALNSYIVQKCKIVLQGE